MSGVGGWAAPAHWPPPAPPGGGSTASTRRRRPTLVGVLGVRGGSTSTYWATSLAATISRREPVMLIDADMECGTIQALLRLERRSGRSLSNLIGMRRVTSADIEAQAIDAGGRLRVVPGLWGSYGPEISDALPPLREAMLGLSESTVVVDLGHPVAHANLRSPRLVAESIAETFSRIYIVMRDSAELVARSIDVLRLADFPHGQVIICEQRGRQLQKQLRAVIGSQLPNLPVAGRWTWDEAKATRMGDSGRPMDLSAGSKCKYMLPVSRAGQRSTAKVRPPRSEVA